MKTWTERVWERANQLRAQESRRARDVVLEGARRSHACAVEHGGTMCGYPLDDDGLCEVHE